MIWVGSTTRRATCVLDQSESITCLAGADWFLRRTDPEFLRVLTDGIPCFGIEPTADTAAAAASQGLIAQMHRLEMTDMSFNVDDIKRDALRVMLDNPWQTPENHATLRADLLEKLSPEERLHGLDPAEVLTCYTPEERLRGLPPEDILRGIDPDLIKAWLKRTGHQGD